MQHQILEAVVELLHVLHKTRKLDQILKHSTTQKKFGAWLGWWFTSYESSFAETETQQLTIMEPINASVGEVLWGGVS